MTFPIPPADNSGGYMVIKYSNGVDTHRMRVHFRPIGSTPTFTAPSASVNPDVMSEFTAFVTKLKPNWANGWTFSLDSIFKANGDGTFTEQFGWTAPATIVGTGGATDAAGQGRAGEVQFNFRTSFGGRARIVGIAMTGVDYTNGGGPVSGAAGGTVNQQIVDYLTTATKTNIVAHDGHVLVNPAHLTLVINRRLRRHYGFA